MRAPRNFPFLLKAYFVIGGVILITFAFIYNHHLIMRMKDQSEATERLFNRYVAIGLEDVEDEDRQRFIREVLSVSRLPGVITDEAGRPLVWNSIGIPQVGDDEYTRILDFDPADPNDPLLEHVLDKARTFDRINEPIQIDIGGGSINLHYGHQGLTDELVLAQYVQIGVIVLFMLLGLLGFRAVMIGEQRSIWVGMAKETAHQIGTPLSSIMGWLTIIREELAGTGDSQKMFSSLEEATADVDRLSRISARFSKIGSMPKLEYRKLAPIVEETVDYFERRRPSLKINSIITIDFEELPLIRCSEDLLGWVFENLIKNSLDAIEGNKGTIHITGRMNRGENRVEVTFGDNGRGMSPGLRRRAFSPGFTTKSRGWGLGLALVKRIVEEIHNGTIRIQHTQPGKGTTFFITFPVN